MYLSRGSISCSLGSSSARALEVDIITIVRGNYKSVTHQCTALDTAGANGLDDRVDLLQAVAYISLASTGQPPGRLPVSFSANVITASNLETHHKRPELAIDVGLNAPNMVD